MLTCLAVILTGGIAGGQRIATLNTRNEIARVSHQQEVRSLKRARIELAARLTSFKKGADKLLGIVDSQTEMGVPPSCAGHFSMLREGCHQLRQALRDADVIAPIFEDLDRLIRLSKMLDEADENLVQALALRSQGDSLQARTFLEASLKSRQTSAAYAELAAMYSASGDKEAAVAAFAEAGELAFHWESSAEALEMLRQGGWDLTQKDTPAAAATPAP